MIDFAASHIGFVIASYALSAVVLVSLCIWVVVRDRKLARRLEGK
jgi:heme exporter protein CcmD